MDAIEFAESRSRLNTLMTILLKLYQIQTQYIPGSIWCLGRFPEKVFTLEASVVISARRRNFLLGLVR